MREINLDEQKIVESIKPLHRLQNIYLIVVLGFFAMFFLGIFIIPILEIILDMENITSVLVIPIILSMIVMVVILITFGRVRKQYVNIYKELLTRPIMEALFDEVTYIPEKGYTQIEFRAIGLMQWKNNFRYSSEDLVEGTYGGVKFKQADIKIQHESGSGKSRHTVTDMDGRLIEFSFKKKIEGSVLVVREGRTPADSSLQKINMESVEFNQQFDVYATDEHSVFYLLTPPLMEYIKNLCGVCGSIYMKFDGEKLYFLRSGGGIAEAAVSLGKFDVHEEIERAKGELEEICRVIELLEPDAATVDERQVISTEMEREVQQIREMIKPIKKVICVVLCIIVGGSIILMILAFILAVLFSHL